MMKEIVAYGIVIFRYLSEFAIKILIIVAMLKVIKVLSRHDKR